MGVWAQMTRGRRERRQSKGERSSAYERTLGGDVEDRPENPEWSAVTALVVSALVTVLVLASLVGLLLLLSESTDSPESALSLVFVAAAVVLILVVCTLTIVLKRLRLTNGEEAMGLPRGSVRAVIALLLILLFFIAAIFLFNSTQHPRDDPSQYRSLRGVDAAAYAAIPADQIQAATPRTEDGQTVYDLVLYPVGPSTPTSDDIAKQLITVLATLVTAVAAFYFGANSVTQAVKEAQGGSMSGGGTTGGGTTGGGTTGGGTTGGGATDTTDSPATDTGATDGKGSATDRSSAGPS